MITNIHGILEARKADSAIIRVGGFSLRVFAPALTLNTLGETGAEVSLHTHFHMREDGIALYGFANEEERDAFEQLIGVSGVGPKVALALLSVMDARTLFRAIAEGDEKRLALVPGVGKRTAERLVLELKRKLPALAHISPAGVYSSSKMQSEVLEALMGLGFSATEAQKALAKIPQDQEMTLEQQITYALRSFARE
jgi:Holliday junction DNA helicase RuvA